MAVSIPIHAKLAASMHRYRILNSRKRAVIALVHSIAFGLLALYQFAIRHHPVPLLRAARSQVAGPIAITAIYLIVTVVLVSLVRYSGDPLERLYFAFCAASAAAGWWRVTIGDPTLRFGSFFRVLMLGCAIILCSVIVLQQSEAAPQLAG